MADDGEDQDWLEDVPPPLALDTIKQAVRDALERWKNLEPCKKSTGPRNGGHTSRH